MVSKQIDKNKGINHLTTIPTGDKPYKMNANELRIGNWVYWVNHDDDNFPEQVVPETIKRMAEDEDPNFEAEERFHSHYEPIPLTPEILEKAGFKMSMTRTCYGVITDDGKLRFSIFHDGRFKVDVCDLPERVNYVHQLQNLYFALTGKELTINL